MVKVRVIQFPTSEQAHEEVGAVKNAFAWGRFVISGSPELVEEIRSRLR